MRRRFDLERQWRGVIAPHLLRALTVDAGDRRMLRPYQLITALTALGALAAAGPTWEREVSPFAEDTAPLVIALDLSTSMNAVDIQPSRLERSKQKVRDLLARREGARTALVAYAGSAHTVLPLSDDPSIFETFLADLTTGVMPVEGKDPELALAEAQALLARDSVAGSILFLTDGIAEAAVPAFVQHAETSRDEVMVLAVGTSEGGPVPLADGRFATDASGRRVMATLDRTGLDALSSQAGVFVASTTVDEADVDRVQSRVQRNLQRAQQDDPTARWKDEGYWLVWPMLLLAALWFRKGWTVRWAVGGLVMVLGGCSPASEQANAWTDLWWTSDQQGRSLFDAGRYDLAAQRFENPAWRGLAAYEGGDLDAAVLEFARLDTPESNFNLAATYARQGAFGDAVAGYDRALELRPGWSEAQENRDLVASLIPPAPEAGEAGPPPPAGDPTFEADSVAFDEQGQQGERGEVEMSTLTDAQIAEMWMRRLQASPAQFLRRRFAIEAATSGETGR
jgi:Ca-activated chloride channel family protein